LAGVLLCVAVGAAALPRRAISAAPVTAAPAGAQAAAQDSRAQDSRATPAPHTGLDRSGKKRVGKASVYAKRFDGRKMADGSAMDMHQSYAASKTLPLGTTAKVTNLNTGKSAVVVIKDRGPYVDGRIVDLSPKTAAQIGITPTQGVAKVEIAPIAVPLNDGRVKFGAGAGTGALAVADSSSEAAPSVMNRGTGN
jgi:rare lipoprotein A